MEKDWWSQGNPTLVCINMPPSWLASRRAFARRRPFWRAQVASILNNTLHVRFSNRPFGVKRFQTIHRFSVDAARGLVLLFGIGTKALPSWDSKTRWNNLWGGLAVRRTVGPSGHTISPHPSSREGHHSTARWNSSFLLSHLIPRTANRRAKATIALFSPRCLAIFIAQALSHDHFAERTSMIWAAS
jgi:hypothetical protein